MSVTDKFLPRAATGIPGLEAVLEGGMARNRLHLLEGSPGTGKTTIALQFLLAGVAKGEIGNRARLIHLDQLGITLGEPWSSSTGCCAACRPTSAHPVH